MGLKEKSIAAAGGKLRMLGHAPGMYEPPHGMCSRKLRTLSWYVLHESTHPLMVCALGKYGPSPGMCYVPNCEWMAASENMEFWSGV